MRLPALFAFICFTSVVLLLWCGVLGVVIFDRTAVLATAAWLAMGLIAAMISGRYDNTHKPDR